MALNGDTASQQLLQHYASLAEQPVRPSVAAMAEAIRSRHNGVAAILFYGSLLRDQDPAKDAEGLMDFYVVVDQYRLAYPHRWLIRLANWILPPNVFYFTLSWQGQLLRAKYAVIRHDQFASGMTRRAHQSVLWARFTQPCRLVWVRDPVSRNRIFQSLAEAAKTCVAHVFPMLKWPICSRDFWLLAFHFTYRSELRAERNARGAAIYEAASTHYDRVLEWALADLGQPWKRDGKSGRIALERPPGRGARYRAALGWGWRRLVGKILNGLRLIKAAYTFDNGLDYILWKVARHSGVTLEVSDWHRRHPVLAAPILAVRLYRRGAFR